MFNETTNIYVNSIDKDTGNVGQIEIDTSKTVVVYSSLCQSEHCCSESGIVLL